MKGSASIHNHRSRLSTCMTIIHLRKSFKRVKIVMWKSKWGRHELPCIHNTPMVYFKGGGGGLG